MRREEIEETVRGLVRTDVLDPDTHAVYTCNRDATDLLQDIKSILFDMRNCLQTIAGVITKSKHTIAENAEISCDVLLDIINILEKDDSDKETIE